MANAAMRDFRLRKSRAPQQSELQLRHLIANYYGMISLIDHQVGRMRIVLRELGLHENTIIVYSSDHGEWLGDHGLLLKGPMAYEGLLRVGLLFEGPGVPAGKVVADPVSTLDLAPTFCDYAGAALGHSAHGRSLRALVERDDEPRLRVFRMGPAGLACGRGPAAAHGAYAAPQADAGPHQRGRRALRPAAGPVRDG
jgi:arylsulfatase A-like enzyme